MLKGMCVCVCVCVYGRTGLKEGWKVLREEKPQKQKELQRAIRYGIDRDKKRDKEI